MDLVCLRVRQEQPVRAGAGFTSWLSICQCGGRQSSHRTARVTHEGALMLVCCSGARGLGEESALFRKSLQ